MDPANTLAASEIEITLFKSLSPHTHAETPSLGLAGSLDAQRENRSTVHPTLLTTSTADIAGVSKIQLTPSPSPTSMSSPSPEPYSGLDTTTLSLTSDSSVSSRSVSGSSRISENGATGSSSSLFVKKRGYMRPQATLFAESAKNRESVMSLGSIAHLQYYFARTGLLDGKGGQLARKDSQLKLKKSTESLLESARSASLGTPSAPLSSSTEMPTYAASDNGTAPSLFEQGFSEEPFDMGEGDADWDRELAMLPPTVSTYKFQRPAYVPPPPDLTMLRRELTEALEDALKALKETNEVKPPEFDGADDQSGDGWYAIQGLHLLDVTTLAIRAAKNYYISHCSYQRLHAIKPETEIRRDLHAVLEILQKMAARNFAGGLRQVEKVAILDWIVGISELIATEIAAEKKEAEERERWAWRVDEGWQGREREREEAFIKCFVEHPSELPEWQDPESASKLPTPFLAKMASGLELIKLHNACVKASKRQFELIKMWHEDTAKPYRRADNLRFWFKSAELRWDRVKMPAGFDALAIALLFGESITEVEKQELSEKERETWRLFDKSILAWCKGVREELVEEWEKEKERQSRYRDVTPKVEIEPERVEKVAVQADVGDHAVDKVSNSNDTERKTGYIKGVDLDLETGLVDGVTLITTTVNES